MLSHLLSYNLISSSQFGFLPKRSTCAKILDCLYNWYKNYSQNKTTHVVYTDISKAFDSVSHIKLIYVIKTHRVNSTLVNWIKSFY